MPSLTAIYEAHRASITTLNKSEAAAYLHQTYSKYVKDHNLLDMRPDFHNLLSENIRAYNSPSAIKAGHPRGNRNKYGKIEYIRKVNKPYYRKSDLQAFFHLKYVPLMPQIPLTAVVSSKPYTYTAKA